MVVTLLRKKGKAVMEIVIMCVIIALAAGYAKLQYAAEAE